MPTPNPPAAHAGAPNGNWNNLKHGFYSKRLRALDTAAAAELELGLHQELALLRALLRQYLALAYGGAAADTPDLEVVGRALDLAGRTILRIAAVARIQFALDGQYAAGVVSGLAADTALALDQVLAELNIQ